MALMTVSRRFRTLAATVGLALTLTAVAQAGPAATAAQPADCTGAERRAALRTEQAEVLELLSKHRTLRNQADLAALSVPDPVSGTSYSFLDHMFASARHMGVGVVDIADAGITPGRPSVLFYAPRPGAPEDEVIDPFGPDFPYELVGWAYAQFDYTPGQPPTGPNSLDSRCIRPTEWFVHERSIHPADTWQNIAVPPEEERKGEAEGDEPILPGECDPAPCPPGIQHGRLWDIHLWLDGDDIPTVSLLNRRAEIPGWDPDFGTSFFFPRGIRRAASAPDSAGDGASASHGSRR